MKKYFLLTVSILSITPLSFAAPKKIYFIARDWPDMFTCNDPGLIKEEHIMTQVKAKLEEQGMEVQQVDSANNLEDAYRIIAFNVPFLQLQKFKQYPKEKCVLFLIEPPSIIPGNYDPIYHQYFSKVYTWNDSFVDNKQYFKYQYPSMHPMLKQLIPFAQKKLCTIIAGNKRSEHPDELYSARLEAIRFFEDNYLADFDLYGFGWDNSFKCYKGPIARKIDYLKYYKFSICYENIKNIPGYITEKIFDCLRAGCVPVYWGASNIEMYIPKNCFIDRRDFESNQALVEFMKNMSAEVYEGYITNIQQFLQTDRAYLFSIPHFVNIFLQALEDPISRAPEKPFVIIIPSYNNEAWYIRNLTSALNQHYTNFRIIYLNDASTDNTLLGVQQLLAELNSPQRVTLFSNENRIGALTNYYYAIHSCLPEEIIVTLDGDDWLSDEYVLTYLNNIYQDPNVWLTYGQYREYPSNNLGGARGLPQEVILNNSYRTSNWVTTHLRTFYADLFHHVLKKDLLYKGKFLPMAWDFAFMFPMLEMAHTHSKFCDRVLYIYNRDTPLNDNKVNMSLQIVLSEYIREKTPYLPLQSLL